MTTAPRSPTDYITGREASRQLAYQPAQLLQDLLDDGVPVIQLSVRGWRVLLCDFEAWKQRRVERARAAHKDRRIRREYVKTGSAGHPIPEFLR